MTADEVIERVKTWRAYTYGPILPEAVVLASHDWLAYAQGMADALPSGEEINFPSEDDVLWAWPDGVLVVFDEPVEVRHTIISDDRHGLGTARAVEPHTETQLAGGFAVRRTELVPTRAIGDDVPREMPARPIVWLAVDPADIVTGHWLPGHVMQAPGELGVVSHSSRLMLSLITALGHRLTRIDDVEGGRAERRRVMRAMPGGLRVLKLGNPSSVTRTEGTGSVEWTHRWSVRGHWRLQPYGPKRSLRKPIWIDEFVKGPEDKPYVARPTLWKTP